MLRYRGGMFNLQLYFEVVCRYFEVLRLNSEVLRLNFEVLRR